MSRSLVAVASVSLVTFACMMHACGGSTSGVDGNGSSSGTSGGVAFGCPTDLPADGAGCPSSGLECEYGTSGDLRCNTVATCASQKWSVRNPGRRACPENGPACPATRTAITPGTMCGSDRLECRYPSGDCVCRQDCGPRYPVERPCDANTPFTWMCATVAPGCPPVRPRLGEACSTAGLECSYAEDPCVQPNYKCENGSWHEYQTPCAISSARYKEAISYLADDDLRDVAEQTRLLRLATWRYKEGDRARHFGFIIEDAPESPAVMPNGERVDLYGYTSMAIASVQVQGKELDDLKREVAELRRDLAETKARCR
jgi:hypothetical protein